MQSKLIKNLLGVIMIAIIISCCGYYLLIKTLQIELYSTKTRQETLQKNLKQISVLANRQKLFAHKKNFPTLTIRHLANNCSIKNIAKLINQSHLILNEAKLLTNTNKQSGTESIYIATYGNFRQLLAFLQNIVKSNYLIFIEDLAITKGDFLQLLLKTSPKV